jgi:tRNA nucleotidyltransferase (CCA-adding enzyme)
VALVPLPGEELTEPDRASKALAADRIARVAAAIPTPVMRILDTLQGAGHATWVVGGSLRDTLREAPVEDWDLTTAARPEQTQALFDDAVYENAFGTVAVRTGDPLVGEVEVTTLRSDHDYADFRRPHHVEFTDSIELDLARRDVTVNAMAWGGRPGEARTLVDPHDGLLDLEAGILRAVGDPLRRFDEDALRMLRVVRLAATLGFAIEPATLAGIQARADNVRHLSGERIAAELAKMLAAPTPSVALRLLADLGLLAPISGELAAQRGVPQNKVPGEDLWDHTLRAVDGAATDPPYIRLAALVHDIGKPRTMAEGRFLGHDAVGAQIADDLLDRLRWRRDERDRIVALVRNHMYGYVPDWSDAAVRRFIAKVGPEALPDLFLLREADNLGSGRARDAGDLDEIRARVAKELSAGVVLDRRGLAIGGDDLQHELGIPPGPRLGTILDALVDRVISDPAVNTRGTLLAIARGLVRTDAS